MRYKVKLNKTDEGYAIWCPSLPGCWSQGDTKEALENIKDAGLTIEQFQQLL
jgi:predicted RNase H-like HicB family nuclease